MIIATPANSPCAPAIGASETPPFMPVTSARISCRSYMQERKPCDQRFRRVRMAREKPVEHRERIARARVVLHRARAERIELRVDREVLARQIRVVAQRLQLGHFRQADRRLAAQAVRQIGRKRRPAAGICAAALRPDWDNSKSAWVCANGI